MVLTALMTKRCDKYTLKLEQQMLESTLTCIFLIRPGWESNPESFELIFSYFITTAALQQLATLKCKLRQKFYRTGPRSQSHSTFFKVNIVKNFVSRKITEFLQFTTSKVFGL